MKKKIIFLTVIVVTVVMVLGFTSFAKPHNRGNFAGRPVAPYSHQGRGGSPSGYFNSNRSDNFTGMRNLDLSSEQMTKMREMMLEFQKERLEVRNQIQQKQLELRELRLSSDLDMNKVKEKMEEISKLQLEVRMKAFEKQEKVKEILTPEQLENCRQGFQMQRFGSGMGRFDSGSNRGCRGNCW